MKQIRLYIGADQKLYIMIDGQCLPMPGASTSMIAPNVIDGNEFSYIFDGGSF